MAYIKVNTQETRTFTNTYNRNETRCLMFCPYISTMTTTLFGQLKTENGFRGVNVNTIPTQYNIMYST